MKHARSIIAAALVAPPGMALAQGFEGAEISADVAMLTADHSFGVSSYAGGVEFGIFSGISIELDLAAHDWRGFRGRASTATLHGIYEIFPGTSVGIYWGRERLGDDRATTYGFEGAAEFGNLDIEGHLGRYEADRVSGELFGVSAAYALGTAFAVTGGLDRVAGNNDFTVTSLGGEYRFGAGPVIYAGVEHESSGNVSDTYLSIGARIELGRGTTFGSRGVSDGRPVF